MNAALTVPVTTLIRKHTPVYWMALQIKCESLKKPKLSQLKMTPKDNHSVCTLQALFL